MSITTAQELLQQHGIEYVATKKGSYTTKCPNCAGGYLNVKLNRDGVVWFCHHCNEGGSEKYEQRDRDAGLGPIKAVYDYCDESGDRLFQVLRFEPVNAPKEFRQRTGPNQAKWSLKGVRIVPYRLGELIEDIAAGHVVFVVEGEKDVNLLRSRGVPATCNPMGAGKWWPSFNEIFRDADVVICGDNDDPGRAHVLLVANNLRGIARRVRILDLKQFWPQIEESDDISDWFETGGTVEQLWGFVDQLKDWSPPTNGQTGNGMDASAPQHDPNKPKLTFFDDCDKDTAKQWIFKNVIAKGEVSSWFGAPGKGKSALLTDVAVNAAAPRVWRGYRNKERCGVVYFALERADLVKRRLGAHKRRDKLSGLPIAVSGQIIDLLNKSCVEIILRTIAEAEQKFGVGVGLAIIDSYSKGISAGGGNEDIAKDQNTVAANLRRVIDQIGIHIAGVGHPGKDETRGERGSSARVADVDLQIHITGDIIKTATIIKANDQPLGHLTSFQLEPFELDPDDDGEPVRTFIISPEIFAGAPISRQGLSDRQRLALDALIEVELTNGIAPPTEFQLPSGIKVVTADQWKQELTRRNILDPEAKNPPARFAELRTALMGRFAIGSRDQFVWRNTKLKV